jgi:hypothetical protein
MDNKRSTRKRIIAIVLFIAALCFSLMEIHEVAITNGGYGVLDMKKYNADVFARMMNASKDMGIYRKYYIFDFVFTAAFLNFMIQMVSGFKGPVINRIKNISYVIAVIRGILDMVENSIMLNQIYSFPYVNHSLINMCNTITRLKFHFMRGWFVCLILMIILGRVSKKSGGQRKLQ